MKKSLLFAAAVLTVTMLIGCDEEEGGPGPGGSQPITANLFPLASGGYYSYSAYEIDANNNKVAGTEHRSSTTVGPQTVVGGITCFALIDSIFSITGALESVDTVYARQSDGDFWVYIGGGGEDQPPFTVPWMPYVKASVGTEVTYTILNFDTTLAGPTDTTTFHFEATGRISNPGQVNVPAGTFQAYEVTVNLSVSVTTVGVGSGSTQQEMRLWLADNVGPVKMREIITDSFGQQTTTTREESVLLRTAQLP